MEAHNLLFQLKQLFKVNCGYIVGIMIGCLCCSTLYACTDDKLPLKETEVVPPKEDDDPEDKPDSLSIDIEFWRYFIKCITFGRWRL